MSSFVHLHNHTHYSLLDGACRIDDLVATAKRFKMKAIAITDHGNMFGVIHFYKQVLQAGLKPLLGMETYIAPGSRFEKTSIKGGKDTSFHLVLLAKSMTGYRNLMRLSSIGYREGFYYKPRIDKEVLEKYGEGLIVLSSCIKGEVPYRIIQKDEEGAEKAALYYKTLFGSDYYLELQKHGLPEENVAMEGLIRISKKLDIPLVATNDTHYIKKENARAQDVLLCIQLNADLDDPERLHFKSNENYFRSPQEMSELFSDVPEAIQNSLAIADKCDVSLDFNAHPLPVFHIPSEEGKYSLDQYLEKKAREGLRKRYAQVSEDLEKRLDYELSVIQGKGYTGYFLIVMDFIAYAKKNKIPVGPGRGSAAGSLVSYCLGITDVDPIRYGLIFERFLNPERQSMPDIDIDFCYERRDEIIEYVKKKYGTNCVTQIITFGSMNARAVIRDVGRVLKIPLSEIDQIAKLIPFQTDLQTAHKKIPDFKQVIESKEEYRDLYTLSVTLEGLSRHSSIHAAGLVIVPDELTNYVPIFRSTQGDETTQYDKESVEAVGLLKIDLLGLRTLTVIDYTIKALQRKGIDLEMSRIPLDDPGAFELFVKGETVGLFQFESKGMQDYLKRLKPNSIEELTAMNALYRPGPMKMINRFIETKFSPEKVLYILPELQPILQETYGVIVYQEQVIQIAHQIGGFDMGKADLFRKAMSSKQERLMQEQQTAFIEGARKKGIEESKADFIFQQMKEFAGYGFNKSHAACYSIVAYQTAYLKAHHPKEFLAANLTSEIGDTDRVVTLIEECRRLGISILPPDVNHSLHEFSVVGDAIRFGLGAIKNVGRGAIDSILEAREKNKEFRTLYDFCENVNLSLVNRKVIESLIQAGALDSLEGNRAQKWAVLSRTLELSTAAQESAHRGQSTLFGEADEGIRLYPPIPPVEPWAPLDALRREKEMLGFYISGHPLEKYEDDVGAFSNPAIADLYSRLPGQSVRICGIVTGVSKRFDKNSKPLVFFNFEDLHNTVRAVAFSDAVEKCGALFEEDRMIMIQGNLSSKESETLSVVVSDALPMEKVRGKLAKRVVLQIDASKCSQKKMQELHRIAGMHPGSCDLCFQMVPDESKAFRMKSKKLKVNPADELLQQFRQIVEKENVWIEG